MWPSSSWPREILLALTENDFAEVPQGLFCELLAWSETMRTTKGADNGFNKCTSGCGANKKRMRPSKLMHTLITDNVAEDQDRALTKLQPHTKAVAPLAAFRRRCSSHPWRRRARWATHSLQA